MMHSEPFPFCVHPLVAGQAGNRRVHWGVAGPGTHEARSQMRYSSAFSCALIGPFVHSSGKERPFVFPPLPLLSTTSTWKSL